MNGIAWTPNAEGRWDYKLVDPNFRDHYMRVNKLIEETYRKQYDKPNQTV